MGRVDVGILGGHSRVDLEEMQREFHFFMARTYYDERVWVSAVRA